MPATSVQLGFPPMAWCQRRRQGRCSRQVSGLGARAGDISATGVPPKGLVSSAAQGSVYPANFKVCRQCRRHQCNWGSPQWPGVCGGGMPERLVAGRHHVVGSSAPTSTFPAKPPSIITASTTSLMSPSPTPTSSSSSSTATPLSLKPPRTQGHWRYDDVVCTRTVPQTAVSQDSIACEARCQQKVVRVLCIVFSVHPVHCECPLCDDGWSWLTSHPLCLPICSCSTCSSHPH